MPAWMHKRKKYQTGGLATPVERERYKKGGMVMDKAMMKIHDSKRMKQHDKTMGVKPMKMKRGGMAQKKSPKRGFASIPSRRSSMSGMGM